ncbi:hypothetical protein JOQ06_029296 [Pogonophryne albipinna]|uniref:Reverse transcriptase domain-containing protein n=1 Tax=Pogonophryne albipinna TaxID=1090488 RepID=A0AAD6B863_9TELE|nr:hypothetical protein JOQ06_029296 [Pogonophryne albipinna]
MKNKVIPNPILPTAGVRRKFAADGGFGPPSGGQHDDRTPNQQGRVLSDHSTLSNALMRCRRPFVMGTFNACTVREEARLVELAHCAEERGVEILGIQDHRRVHTDVRIVYRRVERCTFITASAWRNEAQAATGGVGLMLGPLARKALRRVYHHTDRILIAEFSGNPVTTVIVVYSPTNVAPPEEVEKFYEDLARAVRDVPAHNFLAILGDFNARLGPEDAPYPYHDSTNRNGAYLTALLMEHELLAANTIFRKRTGKRWTFQDRATAGDPSKPDKYRGISLTCITANVYNRMILNRIRRAIDPHLRQNQNGFREGRTTVAQILALRRMIEEVKKDNLTAVLCFIDFKNIFDSIHRSTMVKILEAYGVPPNLLRAIETMYAGTRAKVVTPDGNSEEFDILARVMQGDTLAPFLFIIVLDYALSKAISGREQDLGFTLTPRSAGQAQELLNRVELECAKVGLRLNAKKTEVITYNILPEHPPLTTTEGTVLKEVKDFKYLGSGVNTTEQDLKDFDRRHLHRPFSSPKARSMMLRALAWQPLKRLCTLPCSGSRYGVTMVIGWGLDPNVAPVNGIHKGTECRAVGSPARPPPALDLQAA